MINEEHADQLLGRDMLDREGNRIGEITQVFVDDRTGEPTWVTVKTGWFGLSQSFVPLNKVQWAGEQVQAAYDTATVKDAPRFATDEPLTAQDEDTLHTHYGLADPATGPHQHSASGDTAAPGAAFAPTVPTGSRGRLRRYNADRRVAERADIGAATVCAQCGAYVARDMLDLHDTFHASVARPPGSYARHDVEVTEPATGMIRPPVDDTRHDADVAERAPSTPASTR